MFLQAKVKPLANLREENVKLDNILHLPGDFTAMVDGKLVRFAFKSPNGSSVESFPISTSRPFDPVRSDIDKHNWQVLKAFREAKPEYKNEILLFDPLEASRQEQELQDLSFEIQKDIRTNKSNEEWLTKLYRRIIGNTTGVTIAEITTKLNQQAWENPRVFEAFNGKLIYNDSSFEVLALIDAGIEKGFFSKGRDGFVYRRDGKVYAETVEKAQFVLASDYDTQELLKQELNAKNSGFRDERYVPKEESSALSELSASVGEDVETDLFTADSAVDTEGEEARLEQDIAKNIDAMIEANFIERNGPAWFKIPGQTKNFKKADLSPFFKMNVAVYNDIKLRAGLNN